MPSTLLRSATGCNSGVSFWDLFALHRCLGSWSYWVSAAVFADDFTLNFTPSYSGWRSFWDLFARHRCLGSWSYWVSAAVFADDSTLNFTPSYSGWRTWGDPFVNFPPPPLLFHCDTTRGGREPSVFFGTVCCYMSVAIMVQIVSFSSLPFHPFHLYHPDLAFV